jgi:magnesium transporter
MTENQKNISKKAGLPPGALIHIGNKISNEIKTSIFDYDKNNLVEGKFNAIDDLSKYTDSNTNTWLNIDGLHNTKLIHLIGEKFQLSHLLVEDVLNTQHRPKTEEFDNYIFITLKMLGLSKNKTKIVSEQVSFVLGEAWLISFQEQEGDVFDDLRNRIKEGKGNIRSKKTDYLLYRLIDTIVDNYYFIIEHISESVEQLEDEVANNPSQQSLIKIQQLKRKLINFKKSITPLREAILILQKTENDLISDSTVAYFRDVYEHLIQIIESIESQRDILASVLDLYMSGVSNKMNEIMKVLTIIATIFIPLTFIAGVYGMNFNNIPELQWEYGYQYFWAMIIGMLLLMLAYFKNKKWV